MRSWSHVTGRMLFIALAGMSLLLVAGGDSSCGAPIWEHYEIDGEEGWPDLSGQITYETNCIFTPEDGSVWLGISASHPSA